jgi:hypothetical protein
MFCNEMFLQNLIQMPKYVGANLYALFARAYSILSILNKISHRFLMKPSYLQGLQHFYCFQGYQIGQLFSNWATFGGFL